MADFRLSSAMAFLYEKPMKKGFEMYLELWDESSLYEERIIPVGFVQSGYEEL